MSKILFALVLLTGTGGATERSARLADAKSSFERLGFNTTVMAGGNLSISGDRNLFQKVFNVEIEAKKQSPVQVKVTSGKSSALPLRELPSSLKSMVQAIEFEKGLDFGPTDY